MKRVLIGSDLDLLKIPQFIKEFIKRKILIFTHYINLYALMLRNPIASVDFSELSLCSIFFITFAAVIFPPHAPSHTQVHL